MVGPLTFVLARQHEQFRDVIAALQFAEWADIYPQWTLDDARSELVQPAGENGIPCSWFAVRDNNVVGAVMLVPDGEVENDEIEGPWVAGLVVIESMRHQGIGRALMEFVEAQAQQLQLPRLRLVTPKSADWYESMGWVREFEVTLAGEHCTVLTNPRVGTPLGNSIPS